MSLVTIAPLNLVGEDERGKTYDFTIRETSDFIYIIRIAGSLSGNTYAARHGELKVRGSSPG